MTRQPISSSTPPGLRAFIGGSFCGINGAAHYNDYIIVMAMEHSGYQFREVGKMIAVT